MRFGKHQSYGKIMLSVKKKQDFRYKYELPTKAQTLI
jgi:hypothetical protein